MESHANQLSSPQQEEESEDRLVESGGKWMDPGFTRLRGFDGRHRRQLTPNLRNGTPGKMNAGRGRHGDATKRQVHECFGSGAVASTEP